MKGDIPRLFERIEREIAHLLAVRERLLAGAEHVTPEWVERNAEDDTFVDRLNSFGIQLGRTAESMTKKLLPQLLVYAGEPTGSVIDNLNTAHKIGWIADPAAWADLNRIRNTLVHEYLEDPEFMAAQIQNATPLVDVIASDFAELRAWASRYMATGADPGRES